MSDVVIRIENLSKQYRLGTINHGTLKQDLQSWWSRVRGKEDPNSKLTANRDVNASFKNKHFWALRNASCEVRQGEVLGIIGRNGAGKSTLLKILSRITAPTIGEVKIKGRVASLLEVGTGFHPELTGRENIFLNGAILGMRKTEIKSKFDEIVDFAEIEKFIDTPVKRFSSGMYVRLAFAVAAHLEPEILLVDEVLAVGDAEFQKKCLGKMQDVGKEGRTVLFVSHNMTAISNLCSQLILLKNGSVNFTGSVNEGINNYLSDVAGSSKNRCDDIRNHGGSRLFSRFLNVETFNSKNEKISEFRISDYVKVKLELILTEDVSNLEIGIALHNMTGMRLSHFFGEWEGFPTKFLTGRHTIFCEVPNLMCLPGMYGLTPWIKIRGRNVDDEVESAAEISVIGQDITGFNPDFQRYPNLGIYQKSKWSKL